MHSDAAKEGTGSPAICGNLYQHIWIIELRPEWRALPIVATEFIGGIVNIMVFAPMLHGAPGLLVLDALVVPTVIAGKASSPLMRYLHEYLVALPEYQLVAATCHRHVERACAEQIPREVERHPCQAAPALAGCLRAVRPPRAHGGRRAVRQLQRRQQVWHQVTREQHSLDRPLRQRLVRCEDGVGPVLDLGRRLAPGGRDLQELRVREVDEARGQTRGGRHPPRGSRVLPARRVAGLKLKRAELDLIARRLTGRCPWPVWC